MLRSGAFPPGSRLPPQRRLADELGVSRASLREALSILGTMGVIRVEHGRGTFVAPDGTVEEEPGAAADWRFSARFPPLEVYQFRLVFEPRAAALAALNVTADEIGELETINRRFDAATRDLDLVGCAALDFAFHERIMVYSRNRLLANLYRSQRAVLLESQRLPLARRNRLFEPISEHERLLKALKMHDPEGSSYYMRVHIARAADRVGLAAIDVG